MGETAKQLRELRDRLAKTEAELAAVNINAGLKEKEIDSQLERINFLQAALDAEIKKVRKLETENGRLIETANDLGNTLTRIRKLLAVH